MAKTDHPLFAAVENGDLSAVQRHIAAGGDIDARNSINETPLIWAASCGHLDIVDYLCAKGAHIDAQYDAGNTPLIVASWHGHLPVVRYLVSRGADIHIKNKGGDDALTWAAEHGHLEIVEFLVEHGAIPSTRALGCASEFGTAVETVEYLLQKGVAPEPESHDGFTPLVGASYQGHMDVMDVLIRAGADIHVDDDAPLEWATLFDQLGSVQYLLAAGADPNARHGRESTALTSAVTEHHPNRHKIISALLDAGADVNHGRTDGATALHEAAETGQVDVIRMLVTRGADVSAVTDVGDTPAIAAARAGQLNALCCLSESGADLDHPNAKGETARSILNDALASLPAEK